MLGRADDFLLFGRRDARRRAAERAAVAQADFDEYDGFPVSANEVDFSIAATIIPFENEMRVFFEEARGQPFGVLAAHGVDVGCQDILSE